MVEVAQMARDRTFGLYQLPKPGGGSYPTFHMRRTVPPAARMRLGSTLKITTGKNTLVAARQFAAAKWIEWSVEIAEAASLGGEPVMTLKGVLAAVGNWRRAECEAAATTTHAPMPSREHYFPTEIPPLVRDELDKGNYDRAFDLLREKGGKYEPALRPEAESWAEHYFSTHPGSSQELTPNVEDAMLAMKWQAAAVEADGWSKVPDFDVEMDAAVAAGGGIGAIPSAVRREARQAYARDVVDVLRHRELQRQRAAAILSTASAAGAVAEELKFVAEPPRFQVRQDDKTVGDIIGAFKADRAGRRDGPDTTEKQYGHIFRALEETLGPNKPWRSVTKVDTSRLLSLLRSLPPNAGKLRHESGTKMTLSEAAKWRNDNAKPAMASKTVSTYLGALRTVGNFAIRMDWADKNPASLMVPSSTPNTRRRGFEPSELRKIFAGLEDARLRDAADWWVPALLVWTGARCGEIAQLEVADCKMITGVRDISASTDDGTEKSLPPFFYLDLSVFGSGGARRLDASLKNIHSARPLPIPPDVIKAGFLQFVSRRREAGEKRLFPDLTSDAVGGYTKVYSQRFARYLDSLGLSDPALCLHSFRHGFMDAAREGGLSEDAARALGGWAARGEANKYGSRVKLSHAVPNLAKIQHGGFSLGPSPLAETPVGETPP